MGELWIPCSCLFFGKLFASERSDSLGDSRKTFFVYFRVGDVDGEGIESMQAAITHSFGVNDLICVFVTPRSAQEK